MDIDRLNDNDKRFSELAEALSAKFHCEWEDMVHDSYKVFVEQMRAHSQDVHRICQKAGTILEKTCSLNVEELGRKADALCREADSI